MTEPDPENWFLGILDPMLTLFDTGQETDLESGPAMPDPNNHANPLNLDAPKDEPPNNGTSETHLRLGTANIKYSVRAPGVRADAAKCARFTNIVGMQEIYNQEDRNNVIAGLRLGGQKWSGTHLDTEAPIYWRHDLFQLVSTSARKWELNPNSRLHKHRAVTGALFSARTNPERRFAVVNTHLVNVEPSNPLWKEGHKYLREMITRYYEAGHTVFTIGDMNNRNIPLPPHGTWAYANGIDKIGVSSNPRGVKVSGVRGRGIERLNSDHELVWMHMTIQGR